MKNTPDGLGSVTPAGERFAGQVTYRSSQRRDTVLGLPEQGTDGPLGGADTAITALPTMLEPPAAPSMSISDLDSLAEPVFPSTGWLDDPPIGTLADHPLLRGLLLELPPKGSVPSPGWLDRWFDAARAILDLLYLHNAHGGERI